MVISGKLFCIYSQSRNAFYQQGDKYEKSRRHEILKSSLCFCSIMGDITEFFCPDKNLLLKVRGYGDRIITILSDDTELGNIL